MMSAKDGGGLAQKQTKVLIGPIGCVIMTVTRGRGSRMPKILKTSFVNGLLASL